MNGEAWKLTTYFGERTRVGDRFVADALLDLFGERRVATSILLRGVEGYGAAHHLRTDQGLSRSEDPPVTAIAVDVRSRIEGLFQAAVALRAKGLVTLERAALVPHGSAAESVILPTRLRESAKLTWYLGRRQQVGGRPAFVALCELLRELGAAGASVLLGVDGTRGGRRERARFIGGNVDVPMMVISVGEVETMQRLLPRVGALLDEPMVTFERVRICKRDGVRLQNPHLLPTHDPGGRRLWQKLMIYTSESATHDGQPIHRLMIRRLRARTAVRGATALRGIWGFHGEHEPHGDRLWQLGRQVPVTTVVVDTPEHIREAFDCVDEITGQHGLITVEMVPAAVPTPGGDDAGTVDLADLDY